MAKPTRYVGWNPSLTATEPGGAKKALGWAASEKPPYEYFNWTWETISLWQTWLGASFEIDAATFNTFVGPSAGGGTPLAGTLNTGIGRTALATVGAGATENTAAGSNALGNLTTGDYNTSAGSNSGSTLSTSVECCFFGYNAGNNASNSYNTCIGSRAGASMGNGTQSTYVGYNVGSGIAPGLNYNTVVGAASFSGVGAGCHYNAILGFAAGVNWPNNCSYNIAIGYSAHADGGAGGADYNIAIGYLTLFDCAGDYNVAAGYNSAIQLSSGSYNFIGGRNSAPNLLSGSYNVILGDTSGRGIITSDYSISIGYNNRNVSDLDETIQIGNSIGNAATGIGLGSIVIGSNAIENGFAGTKDIIIGYLCASDRTGTGVNNIFIGSGVAFDAGGVNSYNVAIGDSALYEPAGSIYAVAIGYQAAFSGEPDYGVAIGYYAMGLTTAAGGVGIGYEAGRTSQAYAVSLGYQAGRSGSSYSINLGYQAGYNAGTGDGIHIGRGAGYNEGGGSDCIAIGRNAFAGVANHDSDYCIVIGYNALANVNSDCFTSVVVGKDAALNCLTVTGCVVIGEGAWDTGIGNGANYNTIVGCESGKDLTTGDYNCFYGYLSGDNTTTSSNCTCIGAYTRNLTNVGEITLIGATAGGSASLGTGDTVIGYASSQNRSGGGSYNITIGYSAMSDAFNAHTGIVAIGRYVLFDSDGSSETIVIGNEAGRHVATATDSILIGSRALYAAVSVDSDRDVIIGVDAFDAATFDSFENVMIGFDVAAISTGITRSVVIGALAWDSGIGVGSIANTILGYNGAKSLTSGSYNFLGANSVAQNLTTGDYNVIIGSNAAINVVGGDYNIILGAGALRTGGDGSNLIQLGNATQLAFICPAAQVNISAGSPTDLQIDTVTSQIGTLVSTIKAKKNVVDMEAVDWLYDLRPVNFVYKNDKNNRKQFGLIAEEAEEIAPHICVYRDVNLDQKENETIADRNVRINSDDYKSKFELSSVTYSALIAPMLKAIQDLRVEIDELKKLKSSKKSKNPDK